MAQGTLIKNALIYDGSGTEPYQGDVRIDGERIAEVGADLAPGDEVVIDVDGLSLAPGFIDAHSHNDWFAIKKDPYTYFEPFVKQGITSFVAGNCGLSATGFDPDSAYADKLGGGLFFLKGVTGAYGSLAEFFEAIDRRTPMNMAMLMGHCSARTSVVGFENRALEPHERERMLALLEEGLAQGACGISLGLMYEPGLYAPLDELKDVAELCVRYDVPLTVHARAYTATSLAYANPFGRLHNLRALDELEVLAEGTGLKLQYSHAVFVGKRSLKHYRRIVEKLEQIAEGGADVMFDIFSNDFGVSVITTIMPAWYQAMSAQDKRRPLNKALFATLVAISKRLLGFGFDNMLIADAGAGNERYENKTVHEIAFESGMTDLDAYLHLCEVSEFNARIFMNPYNTEEITAELARHDRVLYMTDAWVEDRGVQYRSIYDGFPRFLHQAQNGRGDSMPMTIRKMTGATADRFALENRGYVRAGCFADIVVFDERALAEGICEGTEPVGITHVFINGRHVLERGLIDEGAFVGAGQALRVAHSAKASCAVGEVTPAR